MRRVLFPVLATVLLVGGLLTATTGVTASARSTAQAQGHPQWRASITFAKNRAAQFRSAMVWRVQRRVAGGGWQLVDQKSWRAGSGLPGRGGRDACVRNRGWLPDGTYAFRQYDDYPGSIIHGRAFRLSDKACGNGTVRRSLLIHSEQAPGNRECPDGPGDQACRWEVPKVNDYKSYGCIKLSPGDIADLTRRYKQQRAAHPGTRITMRVTG